MNATTIPLKLIKSKQEVFEKVIKSVPAKYFENDFVIPVTPKKKLVWLKSLKAKEPNIYLDIVWKARELLLFKKRNLEREDIPTSPNIRCIKQAADNLNLEWLEDKQRGVFDIILPNKKLLSFMFHRTPFNTEMLASICKDKDRCYAKIKDLISTPQTIAFADPNCKDQYRPYITASNQEQIASRIQEWFGFPVIIKPNSGRQGQNVFLCQEPDKIKEAISTIFDRESDKYDTILLAQEYVNIAKEYRVIVFRGQVLLIYEKNLDQAEFSGNLSPLHWEGARSIVVTNKEFQQKMTAFIQPLYSGLDLEYGGLDIVIDISGKMWLIEINTTPGFSYFLTDNDPEILIDMYTSILKKCL